MVARNDIFWAELGPPAGRIPVCVLTRDAAISVLDRVTCAPITTTIRGIASEVEVGPADGLPRQAAINCDGLVTVMKSALDRQPVGQLDRSARAKLDQALRYSLDIIY